MKLVNMHISCGRHGDIEGQMVMDDRGWILLQGIIGERVEAYYDEPFGKHSYATVVLEHEYFTVISEGPDVAATLRANKLELDDNGIALLAGWDPVNVIECQLRETGGGDDHDYVDNNDWTDMKSRLTVGAS